MVKGNIIDIINRKIYFGEISIQNNSIKNIKYLSEEIKSENYILPGLIDSHIHIESSMLIPSEFAKQAIKHGTVATVSDPHEIANVLGMNGINFMIENGESVPFKFYFGAPSCVPATEFETSGAKIDKNDIELLFQSKKIKYLSEMMNFPGVIYDFEEVVEKLKIAKNSNLPIDGHAPGLTGENLKKYIDAGISTDHECFTLNEALEKINLGMKILIRNGSAARNFDELNSLISTHNDMVMLCSDDLHPDDLIDGHINLLVKKALNLGHNIFDVLNSCVLNPIKHYNLDIGLLQENDIADFIIIDNLSEFNILSVYLNGKCIFENDIVLFESFPTTLPNKFNISLIDKKDIQIKDNQKRIRVISAIDGELITNEEIIKPKIEKGFVVSDIDNDVLKIVVINRYKESNPSIGFIKNFGLKKGAIATSVAHDSHNIIAVGTNDVDLLNVINLIIRSKGGLAIVDSDNEYLLNLPIAGLMSNQNGNKIGKLYRRMNQIVKDLGSKLTSPFMTLSFMSLLVIPSIKLSDKGLFDGTKFEFINIDVD